MLIRYILMENPSRDNPTIIRNHINIFDHLEEPKAISIAKIHSQIAEPNSSDFQSIIFPHDSTSNLSKPDLGFLQQQEEILLRASSAGESLSSNDNHLLPLPLTNEEDMKVVRYPKLSSKRRKEPSDISEHVKEMMYRAAALRPVSLGEEEAAERPKRKNVRISEEPQTAAARRRRERISGKLRVLQRLVPGARRMDTASMLDEAANYIKFLKAQVSSLESFPYLINSGGSFLHPIQGNTSIFP